MQTTNSFTMLALSPQDWLTAVGIVTNPTSAFPKLRVEYDNGKEDTGVVTDGCKSIDWGPISPSGAERAHFRYAWAVPCNATAATQAHWAWRTVKDDPKVPVGMVMYLSREVDKATHKIRNVKLCLDRDSRR